MIRQHQVGILFYIFCLILISPQITAQEINRCGTMEILLKDIPDNEKKEAFKPFEDWLQNKINGIKRKRGNQTNRYFIIPVVVHVIHNGEEVGEGSNIPAAQVRSQIEVLNQDFRRLNGDRDNTPDVFKGVAADTQIEFRLALLDPEGNVMPEPGIHRYNGEQSIWNDSQIDNELKPATSWDPKRYMNIWVANLGNSLLGYSSWPKSSGNDGVPFEAGTDSQDGVVINNVVFGSNFAGFGTFDKITDNRYDRGRTTTHEVGHFFGLLHPWGVVGGCNDDDFCQDTPTTLTDRDDVLSPCTFPDPDRPNTCEGDLNDLPDMFQNYMDYTADACMNLFTVDQTNRMLATLENSPNRIELLRSEVIPPEFAPSNVVVSGNALTGYNIQWLDNTANESAFIIERSTSPFEDYEVVGFKPADSQDFDDLPGDGIFYYRIKAVNLSGESNYGNPAATPNIVPPSAPINLQVLDFNQDSVLLGWQNTSETTTSFEVFIDKDATGNFEQWDDVEIPGNFSNIWITDLLAETTYNFRVRSVNAAGSSPFSETVSVTTLPFPPNAPDQLIVALNSETGRFELTWNDNADNETSFSIFRSTSETNGFSLAGTVSENTMSWVDDTFLPPPYSIYYYRIRASNTGGNSAFSDLAIYDGATAFEEATLDNSLVVYPNPARDEIFINAVLDQEQDAQVYLADTGGKILLNTRVPTQNKIWFYSVDLSSYPPGVYFLRFVTSKGVQTVKFLHLQ